MHDEGAELEQTMPGYDPGGGSAGDSELMLYLGRMKWPDIFWWLR